MSVDNILTITFPVFERFTFFEEALTSALNQTVQCPIIVVDNATTHYKFKDICERHPGRVKYYRNEQNLGMFPNWNKCFDYAETQYAIIVGDDDILSPTYVEEFVKCHKENPHVGLYYTNIVFYQEENSTFHEETCKWDNIWGLTDICKLKKDSYRNQLNIPSISCVIDVSLQRKIKFETRLHTANDKLLIYSLPNDTVVYGNSKVLYKYRRHSSNDSMGNMLPILIAAHMLMFYSMRYYSKLNIKQKNFCYRYLYYSFFCNKTLKAQIISSNSAYSDILMDMMSSRNILYLVTQSLMGYLTYLKHKFALNKK